MSIAFRPLAREDFPLVASWLRLPHVRAWWLDPEPTTAAVEADYGDVVDGRDPMRAFVVTVDGAPAGLVQAYRHADEPEVLATLGMPEAAGIDYLLGPPELCGRGVGSAVIREFTTLVFRLLPGVTGIAAAPLARNRASCRALEKAGFRHLGDRDLPSGDPSDVGVNSVYHLPRPVTGRSSAPS